jgi:hypothetical protein
MIKELISLATELDKKGLVKEANVIDKIINKMAEDFGSFDENPQSEEYFDYENKSEVEGLMRQEADAEKLAGLIASAGPYESQVDEELTSLFLEDEYSTLVSRVMSIIDPR